MVQVHVLAVLQLALVVCLASGYSKSSFPKGFMFGTATAAYQVEGAWNLSGKGENIWDHWIHEDPRRIVGNANADIACDSYHKFKQDVALVARMGLDTYRFSLSWSRIFPTGFDNQVNQEGVDYYKNLIAEIEKNNITPIVTLYHWDLPQPIQDLGGWTNTKTVDYFVDYARFTFKTFKSIKFWITINEPKQVCSSGYGKGNMAPGIKMSGRMDYRCAYVVLKAHAAVYRLYKKDFASSKGLLSMAIDGSWSQPATNNKNDVEAAERRKMFEFGLYAHPIFIGDWPAVVKQRVENRSKAENYTTSRLPSFTDAEIKEINGTADFMALNFYTARLISDDEEAPFGEPSFDKDLRVKDTTDPSWAVSLSGKTVVPWSIRSFLNWLKNTYNNPHILITENGVADDGSTVQDIDRVYYIAEYLNAVLEAIDKDKVRVHGYTFWSLLDNFEWTKGYSEHYGLYSVNFTDPGRTRTEKSSVEYYQNIVKTRMIVDPPATTTRRPTTTPSPVTRPVTSATPSSTSNSPTSTPKANSGVFTTVPNILLCSAIMLVWRLSQF